jgi:hypothetical protein
MQIHICPHCHEVVDDDGFCYVCLRQFRVLEGKIIEEPVVLSEKEAS